MTKSSSNKEIRKGDKVWFSPNGDLNIVGDNGWLEKNDLTPDTIDFESIESVEQEILVSNGREMIIDK